MGVSKKFLPGFISICMGGLTSFLGGFLIFVVLRLVPLRVIGFHFPLLVTMHSADYALNEWLIVVLIHESYLPGLQSMVLELTVYDIMC